MLQQIVPAVTCLLFAAHVALGCCAHHGHERHGSFGLPGLGEAGSQACQHHDIAPGEPKCGHGHSGSEGPGDSEDCGAPSCHYCKADVVRLDNAQAPSWQSVALFRFGVEPSTAVEAVAIGPAPGCVRAGPDLFVWHCALLI